MCLAVPMKIVSLQEDGTGIAEIAGARYQVELGLVEGAVVGDYVIVHAGYAIEKLDCAEAEERLALFAQMAQSSRGGSG